MIDLSFPELPSRIECGGSLFIVDTSFRTWLRFGAILRERRTAWPGVFAGEVPEGDWVPAALEFYESRTEVPRASGTASARLIDPAVDGELIVAAFQQAYGIDLTEGDMHWHRFKALLAGVPDETKLAKVMGYRAYTTPPRKYGEAQRDADMRELRRAWELPPEDGGQDAGRLLEWAETALPW